MVDSGKGPVYSATLSRSQNCGEIRNVEADSFSGCHLSRDGDQVPDFEGFPNSRNDQEASESATRVPVLQKAISDYLEEYILSSLSQLVLGVGVHLRIRSLDLFSWFIEISGTSQMSLFLSQGLVAV